VPAGEFDLIDRYLRGLGAARADVRLGVGDDAALVEPPAGQQLALAADTLVSGLHFPAGFAAADVGHRVLAVNLSDLAAMGATPAWALLTLTLPSGDEGWVAGFAQGLDALARRFGTALVGGDTTSGPLSVTVAIAGFVPAGQALTRSGARPGDGVWISGTPGESAAGLAVIEGRCKCPPAAAERLVQRFRRPEPRIALGLALRGLATACIDVSDGLLGDLGKLCAASGVGAALESGCLPRSADLASCGGTEQVVDFILAGGDDYELLFTLPPSASGAAIATAAGLALTRIGTITAAAGITLDGAAPPRELAHGFDHFGAPARGSR
jgi:thiamine-monophosphate kinase